MPRSSALRHSNWGKAGSKEVRITNEELRRKRKGTPKSESIQVFDSQGEAYKQAFQIFLDHTDQKRNAKRFLQKLISGLPKRTVFVDAGAGNGEMTKAFAGAFRRTIAVEPNPHLLAQLKRALPQAEAIGAPILAANPKVKADFV